MIYSLVRSALFCAILFGLNSCRPYIKEIPTGNGMFIENVYAHPSYDHARIKSVLLLPIANPEDNQLVTQHIDRLRQSFIKNMAKFSYFYIQYEKNLGQQYKEVISMENGSYDRLRIGALGQAYNAQALLKLSITEYRPFFPMSMRLRGVLVDANTGERIWSFDQVFDTDDAAVENVMQTWWNARMAGGDGFNRYELNKLRPSFFMNFVFYTMGDSYGNSRVKHIKAIAQEVKENKKKMEEIEEIQEDAYMPGRNPLSRF